MGEAWTNKICSPYEFRKCLMSDIEFIDEYEKKLNEKFEQMEQEYRVQAAMENLMNR